MLRLTRPTRRTTALSAAGALAVSGALVLGIGLSAGDGSEPAAAAPVAAPAEGSTAALGGSSAPGTDPEPTPAVVPPPPSDVHIEIPSVGLDLPVLPLTVRDGVINPPLLTAAYFVDAYGEPVGSPEQADNTLYIAAHSAGRGSHGFDPMLTRAARDSALDPGDPIDVRTADGTVTYTVERTQRYEKKALAEAADVWEAAPGRLVLITCFQRGGGRTTENLVVFAES